jgi:hypothetical protein
MDDLGVGCQGKWASLVWRIHFASASFLIFVCLGRTLFDSLLAWAATFRHAYILCIGWAMSYTWQGGTCPIICIRRLSRGCLEACDLTIHMHALGASCCCRRSCSHPLISILSCVSCPSSAYIRNGDTRTTGRSSRTALASTDLMQRRGFAFAMSAHHLSSNRGAIWLPDTARMTFQSEEFWVLVLTPVMQPRLHSSWMHLPGADRVQLTCS